MQVFKVFKKGDFFSAPLDVKIPLGLEEAGYLFTAKRGGIEVTRYNLSGKVKYQQVIAKDGWWHLDPINCYRIVEPLKEKNVCRRLLRIFGIPVSVFHKHVDGKSMEISWHQPRDIISDEIETDGVRVGDAQQVVHECLTTVTQKIVGATWAVVLMNIEGWGGDPHFRISSLYCTENADLMKILATVHSHLGGKVYGGGWAEWDLVNNTLHWVNPPEVDIEAAGVLLQK